MSKVLEKINTTKEVVEALLEAHEHLRDDHLALTANIWFKEIKRLGHDPMIISAYMFFEFYISGKMTTEETIARSRRKIQEENPRLRGKHYDDRKVEELLIRQNINNHG